MISVRSRGREEVIELDEFEARVKDGRILPSTLVQFPVVTGPVWVKARDLELFRRLYAPARLHFARGFSLNRFPFFTLLLCLVQTAIFFYLAKDQSSLAIDPLIDAGAKVQPNILELGQTWRLLTANLLHRDRTHLLFNMFFLFNIGGAVENAYRVRDYLFILVVSGVATTVLSTLMSAVPSVGASGMILGLFGAASVFGFKFGAILPPRYRRYFGGAALPYALFILYVGLTTPDTDNWGHLGGLMGGMIATLALHPRLWVEAHADEPLWGVQLGAPLGIVAVIGAVLGAAPVVRALGPAYETFTEDKSGITFTYPRNWFSGQNHLGYPAKGNTLGTSVGVRAETRQSEPYTLREVRDWFMDAELGALVRRGDITKVEVLQEGPIVVPGGRALEIRIALESRAGPQWTRNILIERGYYRYAVVLSAPERWAAEYGAVLERMAAGVRLSEPRPLAKARAKAEVFSGMTTAHVELGREWARAGDAERARAAFRRALETDPDDRDAKYGLAKVVGDYGGDADEAEVLATALWERQPDEPALAALVADLRERQGRIEAACEILLATFDRLEQPPEELRRRVVELRCLRSY